MKAGQYIYNNEAIGSVALLSVIKECKAITYSKAMLILPLIFHEQSNAALRRSNTELRSSEEFIVKRLTSFGNFNSRYLSLLPVSINSLMILREMGCISIDKHNISYRFDSKFDLSARELGVRANKIIKASEKLSTLLTHEDDNSLYLKLRIQL
jgi:hypothetical protein